MLWIARDITESHLAREEMKQREELFRLLAENSSDCLSTCRSDGTLIYISPVSERIFGYKPEELCGRDNFDRVHPEDMPTLMAAIQQSLEDPGFYLTIEIRLLHKAGHWMWTEITGHTVMNGRGETEISHGFARRFAAARERRGAPSGRRKIPLDF